MVETGTPAISPRWWRCLERFIRSDARQLVIRKGRRVGASTIVFPRLAVATILASEHQVPAGELLLTACVSVKRSEATRRLRNCKAVLDVVGLSYLERGDELELPDLRRAIVVLTASARTEVGHTIELLWCDEVARWWSDDASSNPASEVLAALRPALATVRGALKMLAVELKCLGMALACRGSAEMEQPGYESIELTDLEAVEMVQLLARRAEAGSELANRIRAARWGHPSYGSCDPEVMANTLTGRTHAEWERERAAEAAEAKE